MQRFLESNKSVPILLASLTILVYGVFIPFTGFYWDDWPFAWIAKFLGPAEFLPAFIGIRPFLIPIFYLTTSLIPPIPLYWQIFALFIRFLAGLSAWFALSHIWPNSRLQTLVAAFLLIVFPAYSQHWVAFTHINQEWIAFILYLLSFGFTASALRDPAKFKLYTFYALPLYFEGLFATEYFFGMEPLRFFFIWVIVSEGGNDWRLGAGKALKVWLPYLGIWIMNGIWLTFFYSQGNNSYDLEVLNAPFSITTMGAAIGETIWKVGVVAWVQVLSLTTKTLTSPSTIVTYGLIGLTFLLLFPVLKKYAGADSSKTASIQFLLIGLVGIVLGMVPSLVAGLPFRLQSSFDRFAISMMIGGCLFIVGVFDWLIQNQRHKIYGFAILIALAAGQQFFNGNIFRRDWERQQDILWQLKWRIPSLEPNTVILTDEIAVDYESDESLTGPLNWMYAPDYKSGNLPYLILYVDSRLGGTLPSIKPDTDIQYSLRTIRFYGNTSQSIVIHLPEDGCLKVLEPELGDAETYNKKLRRVLDVIELSDPALIYKAEVGIPIFLSEPAKTWCYYYTKAELARQFKEWDQILELLNGASAMGYGPIDPFDWLPFIEANAMTSNFDQARLQTRDAIKADPRTGIGVCKVWERVQAQAPWKGEAQIQILEALTEFDCEL
jgi:hypothetical protein